MATLIGMENTGMFRQLVETSSDIVIVTDSSLAIIYASPAAGLAFGIPMPELIGRNVSDFFAVDTVGRWTRSLQKEQQSFKEELSLLLEGQQAFFEVTVSTVIDEFNVTGLALHLHDITEKKAREDSLLNSNKQLDQVIYKTTHDLKAPLMSALGLINLAEKAEESEKDEYLGMIKKSLLKLDSFIEEMNDFFRNEKLAVRRELISVEEMINDGLQFLDHLSDRKLVKVTLSVEGDSPFYSDAIRLKTILINILSNAIKYCDPNKIEPFISIFVSLNEEFCQIRIVDNGIGIATEMQGKIFDLFYRATTQSQGTGLGLFIVKDTIEKLQGTIDVSSVFGEGTAFVIRVPNQLHQPVTVE